MTAVAQCQGAPTRAGSPILPIFGDDLKAFVKYECDPTWSYEEIVSQLRSRWPEPYPAVRTVNQWREQARAEQEACRRQVWEREFSGRARYLVPKVLVALDTALDTATEALGRAREAKNDKAVPALTKAVVSCAAEMLTHLGAPSQEAHADPEAIKREALAALMAAGQSAEQAESVFAAIAGGAQAALAAGEGEE